MRRIWCSVQLNASLIRWKAILAKILSSNESDISLIRGMIAENEGVFKDEIELKIEPVTANSASTPADELDVMFK